MPGVPPKAFETLKAKFKALLRGKKSKKAEAGPTAGAETDAAAPPTANSGIGPNDEGTAPEVTATGHTNAENPDPSAADQTSAVAEPANTTETAPEALKVEDPIKTESSAPIVSATAPQL
ncbi:hypothetical protein OCU04_008610 [Sclerotinia nivalis]|uniref:Uncharacterized protein n=1 Tax=Sclerotinia nivalis TaxID=352851 RepID=A0A9X0AIF2_9HELO|nr:hypothetical protein OCU04_008610 [Sclerotinia nivalis]